jgi:hypothetical protein
MKQIDPEMLRLQEIISKRFSVDMNSPTRKRDYVNARLVYSAILRERGCTFESIAKSIDKDHATVIHYIRNSAFIFKQDKFLNKKFHDCREIFFKTIDPDTLPEINIPNKTEVEELKEHIEILNQEIKNLVSKLNTHKRLSKIINLIEERTHYGKEEIVEKKIREMFNGFSY